MSTSSLEKEDIEDHFKCPACKEFLSPPIMLCEEGHSLCEGCWKKVIVCPMCKRPTTPGRNYTLEELVRELRPPCRYSEFGCSKILTNADKTAHENYDCNYRPFECIVCRKLVPMHKVNDHYLTCKDGVFAIPLVRPSIREGGEDQSTGGEVFNFCGRYDIVNSSTFLSFLKLGEYGIFLFRLLKSKNYWYSWVSVAKCLKEAEEFNCKIEVLDMRGTTGMTYTGPVNSLHENQARVIEKGYCLITPNVMMMKIKNKTEFCSIHYQISKYDRIIRECQINHFV